MKLNLKGYYLKDGILNFVPCDVIIEFGKIQKIKFDHNEFFTNYQPSYNSEYGIEKIFYEKSSKNLKFTYRILYHNDAEETKIINIKPNQFQVFRIKWAFKKYIIQSDDMRKDILKYVIGGFLGYIATLIIQEVKEYRTTPESPKIENQESFNRK
ncbi:hypothetical protein [Flavobacterium hibernum]|uniref:Uncharacterized protein n=1 Tax=Flavobacterium hibernum TaxID=37752 RepID=A0A0D0EFM2_9FLAO|nr:hypothetical protein [Flavobacterium hibernum]KIO54349.1 hypothetical protein IW18_02520 [Flavobacterium hibernum]OXA88186.1 hypothetical protein B0A73_10475 [Flavobacterium hibernum]STO10812.1 Uncharacterised protein [Flavobacterium hibernum]